MIMFLLRNKKNYLRIILKSDFIWSFENVYQSTIYVGVFDNNCGMYFFFFQKHIFNIVTPPLKNLKVIHLRSDNKYFYAISLQLSLATSSRLDLWAQSTLEVCS